MSDHLEASFLYRMDFTIRSGIGPPLSRIKFIYTGRADPRRVILISLVWYSFAVLVILRHAYIEYCLRNLRFGDFGYRSFLFQVLMKRPASVGDEANFLYLVQFFLRIPGMLGNLFI